MVVAYCRLGPRWGQFRPQHVLPFRKWRATCIWSRKRSSMQEAVVSRCNPTFRGPDKGLIRYHLCLCRRNIGPTAFNGPWACLFLTRQSEKQSRLASVDLGRSRFSFCMKLVGHHQRIAHSTASRNTILREIRARE